jgi:thiamine pyrophosphokinase
LFGAGETPVEIPFIEENSLIIAADGGYKYLSRVGIAPHVLIGDFDSLPEDIYIPPETQRIALNRIKDNTDMEAALQLGIQRGCKEFKIYGGTGGRTSHLIANIALLVRLAKNSMTGWLISGTEIITVLHNDKISFSKSERGFVSVFSLSEKSVGVSESGLKYDLNAHTLLFNDPIGISNEFIGVKSNISVKEGTLLIIKEP